MIKAERKKWAFFVFDIYLERLLKKYFHDFILINSFPKISVEKSLVVAPNHFSWWDGFFIYFLLKKKTNKKVFIMMLENQLRRYWFFQKVGCFSTNPENKQSSIATLRYTLDLLSDPESCVVIFPQGEIEPFEKSSYNFNKGIEFLSMHSQNEFDVLPIANKIFYTNEKLPLILTRAEQLIKSSDIKSNPNILFENFYQNINLLKSDFSTEGESIF